MTRDYDAEQGLSYDTPLPTRAKPKQAEWRLHSAAAKLCYRREREDTSFRFFSLGGEGSRTPARAAIAKLMGQNRRGVPDMVLMRRRNIAPYPDFAGVVQLAFVEFKLPGKQLTPEQAAWFAWMQGYAETHRVDSLEQFRLILSEF